MTACPRSHLYLLQQVSKSSPIDGEATKEEWLEFFLSHFSRQMATHVQGKFWSHVPENKVNPLKCTDIESGMKISVMVLSVIEMSQIGHGNFY